MALAADQNHAHQRGQQQAEQASDQGDQAWGEQVQLLDECWLGMQFDLPESSVYLP